MTDHNCNTCRLRIKNGISQIPYPCGFCRLCPYEYFHVSVKQDLPDLWEEDVLLSVQTLDVLDELSQITGIPKHVFNGTEPGK